MLEVKTEKNKVTLPILITEKENTQPLLGLDWESVYRGTERRTSSEE